jgi:hypothetical protein
MTVAKRIAYRLDFDESLAIEYGVCDNEPGDLQTTRSTMMAACARK